MTIEKKHIRDIIDLHNAYYKNTGEHSAFYKLHSYALLVSLRDYYDVYPAMIPDESDDTSNRGLYICGILYDNMLEQFSDEDLLEALI